MKRTIVLILLLMVCVFTLGCVLDKGSDSRQREQSEVLLAEATSQVGMPAIKNFRERKILKDILEMRDQTSLVTYAYVLNHLNGKWVFVGETVGFPIPYATQFTNPQKVAWLGSSGSGHYGTLPQADPNALFSPSSAEGTWLLMRSPEDGSIKPVYMEEKVNVFPFPLPEAKVQK